MLRWNVDGLAGHKEVISLIIIYAAEAPKGRGTLLFCTRHKTHLFLPGLSEPPSNVTRISRVFRRTCSDGAHQVINYFPGVGTANAIDRFTGGAFGMGLDQDIREVYNFVCANYVDGDDIILIGFSRGAFTARSVADMIASVGLLTPEGLDHFHAIFDDYENMGNPTRATDAYLVAGLPEYDRSHGQAKIEWENARMLRYKHGLREASFRHPSSSSAMTRGPDTRLTSIHHADEIHPRHISRRRDRDQGQSARRMGYGGHAGDPAGARDRGPRLCRPISFPPSLRPQLGHPGRLG